MLRRILCFFTGHARGRRIETVEGVGKFECPNCLATWTRKDRKKS